MPGRKQIAIRWYAARGLLAVLVAVLLAGCSQRAVLDRLTTPQERQFSEKLIVDLAVGHTQDVSNALAPELRDQLTPQLPRMRAFLPAGPGTRIRLIEADIQTLNGVRHSYLTYEADQDDRHAMIQIGLQSNPTSQVTDFYIYRLSDTLDHINAFSLSGKSTLHYAFLTGAAAAVAITFWGLIRIWRAPDVKRRWLWTIGCIFGVGHFAINWTTGAVTVLPLYLQLFSAGGVRPGVFAPWDVSFGIPLVAIIFLVRRFRQARQGRSASTESEPV